MIWFKRCVCKIYATRLGETISEFIVIGMCFFCLKHISWWRLINQKAHSLGAIIMNFNFNKINKIGSFGIESFLGQACSAFIKPEARWPKSPDLNPEKLNPLDFLVWRELLAYKNFLTKTYLSYSVLPQNSKNVIYVHVRQLEIPRIAFQKSDVINFTCFFFTIAQPNI